ncbi:acetylornithine aminotransferase apoenzyme [Alkalispirochaeta americana]|uniref:Acetylornithine aminotransferase apoenzyme n=1 Tax=Alkalispirochaeta americana TaxID=159291 RepID=A0A1N6V9L2_9SPIO|nr:aminotransferase class III-fold pyridoxal phosphate-dependent enzyme [Alkalispirochaeta americana]SIQ74571.1 acetylornithine aminotransferase apoenzyme [Alkalispirochaeta americana]
MTSTPLRTPAMTDETPFARNYARQVLEIASGRGCIVKDTRGNSYLDFGSGIAVNALGYGDRGLARRVARQMRKLVHVSNLYATTPSLALAEQLLELAAPVGRTPFQAVHFGNSGAEANEAAIKYARLRAHHHKGPGHHTIVAFEKAFHGRTLGALSATPNEAYRKKFEPLLPGFTFLPLNDRAALDRAVTEETAAVILEPLQGEGGLNSPSPEMVELLNRISAEREVLVIADEIQTGLGRLGELFGSTVIGLTPDIITLSKPLAGGLPLSATLIPASINERLEPGDHGTTFGGGPVTAEAGRYVLDRITAPGFMDQVRQRAQELEEGLQGLQKRYSWITERPGQGLLRGLRIDLGTDQEGLFPTILPTALERGLLILRSGSDVIRIAPPLIISRRDMQRGLAILDTVFHTINARRHQ